MSDFKFSQMTENKPFKLEKNGKAACVTRIGDQVFAVADTCTHSEASLSEGDILDYKIECWLHGAEFDVRTGEAVTPPATEKLEVYTVAVDGDSVTVEI